MKGIAMAAMTAAFLFFQLFFTPYILSQRDAEGARAVDLLVADYVEDFSFIAFQ